MRYFQVKVTCDYSWHSPANGVVEPHGSIVNVALFGLHSIDMEAIHKHPSKCGHEEVMQQDGDHRAQELKQKGSWGFSD